ncbi:MAG: hypothetical protein IIV64_06700 [Muribaculaceae bacterium]|nr:hypothetical protein [Muribaculaceae bacterium]
MQAKSGKGAKFSLQGGRSIADKYEKKVNTKGKGGAMHLSKFNFMEAWQDEMRALKEVQRIIEQEYGIVLEPYEELTWQRIQCLQLPKHRGTDTSVRCFGVLKRSKRG